MKKTTPFLLSISIIIFIYSCDKIEGPVKESTTAVTVGSIPGTLKNIEVDGAVTTANDNEPLKASIAITADPKYVNITFNWHGIASNTLSQPLNGGSATFTDEAVTINAPSPYGKLSFLYSASISDSSTAEAEFVVPFTPVTPLKKILIEDYTGHTCGNCPRATRLIYDSLVNEFPERIVSMSVHAGGYAQINLSNCYTEDFRTDAATTLNDFFGCTALGNPTGMVNRVGYPGTQVKFYVQWHPIIVNELNATNSAYVAIVPKYNDANRTVNFTVSAQFLNSALTGDYKLAVCLAEDSIVACQTDYDVIPNDVTDYVHRDVFRDAINTTYGEDLISTPQLPVKYIRLFSYQVPARFKEDHCKLIAYVYDASNYHILQSEEMELK